MTNPSESDTTPLPFSSMFSFIDLVVAYGKEGVPAEIRKDVHVLKEAYDEKGVHLTIKAIPGTLTSLKRRLAS